MHCEIDFLNEFKVDCKHPWHNPATGEWNDSLAGDYLWTNVNFGEAMPGVLTPLTWSVTQHIYESCTNLLPGFNNSGNIGGRAYLNLSVSASAFRALGLNKKVARRMLEGMFTLIPEDMEIPTVPLSKWSGVAVLCNLLKLLFRYTLALKKLPRYLDGNPGLCMGLKERIQATNSKVDLNSLWHQEIEPHLFHGAWIYVASASSVFYTGKLRRELTVLVGAEDTDRLMSSLGNGSGTGDVSGILASLGPVLGMDMVASGEMDRSAYMSQYGHRGPNEFELSVPRPAEDPGWFDEQVALFEKTPANVKVLLSAQRAESAAARDRLQAGYPRRAPSFRQRIYKVISQNLQREAARSEYTRDRWLARSFALRAGQLSGLRDDVFFLTIEELLDVLSGNMASLRYIPARKETLEKYSALPPYPPLIQGHFYPFQWAAEPGRRNDIYNDHAPVSSAMNCPGNIEKGVIRGSAVSSGRVEGVVRCLNHPGDGNQLQQGEILVTAQTDIAWTPLFLRAAAIVTDVGAPLSHAAIIARELGIPAVVGCSNATVRLHTGDRVLVDGGKGIVVILNQ